MLEYLPQGDAVREDGLLCDSNRATRLSAPECARIVGEGHAGLVPKCADRFIENWTEFVHGIVLCVLDTIR